MRELWRPGVPQLKLRVFQFDALLRGYLPKLHAHFQSIGLAPDVLVSQWFLTLFSYALPFHALARAWDVVFTEGWKMLFRLGLARLSSIAHQLLPLSLEETSKFLRSVRRMDGGGDLSAAARALIHPRQHPLAALRHQFLVFIVVVVVVVVSSEGSRRGRGAGTGGAADQGDSLYAGSPRGEVRRTAPQGTPRRRRW